MDYLLLGIVVVVAAALALTTDPASAQSVEDTLEGKLTFPHQISQAT